MKILQFVGLLVFVASLTNRFDTARAQNKMEYTDPIVTGFYPDPSICRVGRGW